LPPKEGVRLYGKKLLRIDSYSVLLKYIYNITIPRVASRIIAKFLSSEIHRWNIAYSYHNNHTKSLWRYKEIKNPKGRYFADPFVFKNNGCNYLFFEDYSLSEKIGWISTIKITDDGYEFLGIVLKEDFHLSFPFIFKDGDTIYMVPESNDSKDIRLYKCVDFPMKWEFVHTLFSKVSASDTMIINKEGYWFLMTNIDSSDVKDHHSELHIFYSKELLSKNWKPLKQSNPIIFDSRNARNGGFFIKNNILYRINQIQGKDHYGKSFGVNEVITLSRETYVEKRVSTIHSDFKEGIICTHHYNANEEIGVVDYARKQRLRSALNT